VVRDSKKPGGPALAFGAAAFGAFGAFVATIRTGGHDL
jgi:hypothetical protein